ncbi:hypothetical protein [Streptomyces capitiformicae]|uniref:Uncharacterized protein n=1 Tax=Streptomyces capitiformicae TaxID=2014920 RepID=A0A919DFC0_9ACTN|nr:hypothetical protein [Streptomyces capitiformicae]GHE40139.1 hypothetical protein GCM10017771_59180 [Streptomyces capitiformicae]
MRPVHRRINLDGDGHRTITAARPRYAAALATAVLTYAQLPASVTASLPGVAGTCGPLLTDGRAPSAVRRAGT